MSEVWTKTQARWDLELREDSFSGYRLVEILNVEPVSVKELLWSFLEVAACPLDFFWTLLRPQFWSSFFDDANCFVTFRVVSGDIYTCWMGPGCRMYLCGNGWHSVFGRLPLGWVYLTESSVSRLIEGSLQFPMRSWGDVRRQFFRLLSLPVRCLCSFAGRIRRQVFPSKRDVFSDSLYFG